MRQETLEEAKKRAANYMSLKGALEPKDVVLGYKTSLDAQMLDSQYVDFSNPNADKITSNTTSTISVKQETLEEAAELSDVHKMYVGEEKRLIKKGFIAGAKWQQERMYSKEDMLEFTKYLLSKKITKAKSISDLEEYLPKEFQLLLGELMRNGKELISEWFEQFKKQQDDTNSKRIL